MLPNDFRCRKRQFRECFRREQYRASKWRISGGSIPGILNDGCRTSDLNGTDPLEEVLKLMTRPLVDMGIVDQPEKFAAGLFGREQMMTTGVVGGIALPHLRNLVDQRVDRPYLVVGISPRCINWDSIDGEPVNLILLPVTGNEVLHVHTLAAIRRMLIEASSPQDVMSVLIKIETIQLELYKKV